jgi:hypothetical protein
MGDDSLACAADMRGLRLLAADVHVWVPGNPARYLFLFGIHYHVNVFEDVARGDAEDAVKRFDEVVAFASGVLAAERVGKAEIATELFCLNEKSGAIGLPLDGFHGLIFPDHRRWPACRQ